MGKTLGDLTEMAFAELDRLMGADGEDAVNVEIGRAKAFVAVSGNILDTMNTVLRANEVGANLAGAHIARIHPSLTLAKTRQLTDGEA